MYGIYCVNDIQLDELDKTAVVRVLRREYGTDILAIKQKCRATLSSNLQIWMI